MIMRIASNPDLVRWRELHDEFKRLFPRTIEDVLANEISATVIYCGIKFEIRPHASRLVFDFEVWGEPAVNQFPNPKGSQ